MAKSLAWLRANNQAHDQLFLDISWWKVTSKPSGTVTAQLQQVCGQLHYNRLKYGVMYTDECFWLLRYDADSAQGALYVSEGIMVSGMQPTVFLMLLFVGDLAQQHAANATPSITRRQPLPLMLPFLGSFHDVIIEGSLPESSPHELRMGPLLGRGSTGSVRLGRTGNVDLAIKLFEGGVDASSACQRLQHELDLYQGLLHPLQGISVPRLMASGTFEDPTGTRLPVFALEFLPVSLADVEAHLGASECEHVLEALNSIHQQGVLHGDIEPRHVVYSSWNTLAEPKWIDFSNASRAQSSTELADEVEQCRDMSQELHKARRRPYRLHRSATARGVCQATRQLTCRSCVLTI
ncbi:hypothetical protein ABBQ38_012095 [Trebouxia sp. C0009 RCD-2024]